MCLGFLVRKGESNRLDAETNAPTEGISLKSLGQTATSYQSLSNRSFKELPRNATAKHRGLAKEFKHKNPLSSRLL